MTHTLSEESLASVAGAACAATGAANELREDISSLTVAKLKERLKARGLKTSGIKAELLERLLQACEKQPRQPLSHKPPKLLAVAQKEAGDVVAVEVEARQRDDALELAAAEGAAASCAGESSTVLNSAADDASARFADGAICAPGRDVDPSEIASELSPAAPDMSADNAPCERTMDPAMGASNPKPEDSAESAEVSQGGKTFVGDAPTIQANPQTPPRNLVGTGEEAYENQPRSSPSHKPPQLAAAVDQEGGEVAVEAMARRHDDAVEVASSRRLDPSEIAVDLSPTSPDMLSANGRATPGDFLESAEEGADEELVGRSKDEVMKDSAEVTGASAVEEMPQTPRRHFVGTGEEAIVDAKESLAPLGRAAGKDADDLSKGDSSGDSDDSWGDWGSTGFNEGAGARGVENDSWSGRTWDWKQTDWAGAKEKPAGADSDDEWGHWTAGGIKEPETVDVEVLAKLSVKELKQRLKDGQIEIPLGITEKSELVELLRIKGSSSSASPQTEVKANTKGSKGDGKGDKGCKGKEKGGDKGKKGASGREYEHSGHARRSGNNRNKKESRVHDRRRMGDWWEDVRQEGDWRGDERNKSGVWRDEGKQDWRRETIKESNGSCEQRPPAFNAFGIPPPPPHFGTPHIVPPPGVAPGVFHGVPPPPYAGPSGMHPGSVPHRPMPRPTVVLPRVPVANEVAPQPRPPVPSWGAPGHTVPSGGVPEASGLSQPAAASRAGTDRSLVAAAANTERALKQVHQRMSSMPPHPEWHKDKVKQFVQMYSLGDVIEIGLLMIPLISACSVMEDANLVNPLRAALGNPGNGHKAVLQALAKLPNGREVTAILHELQVAYDEELRQDERRRLEAKPVTPPRSPVRGLKRRSKPTMSSSASRGSRRCRGRHRSRSHRRCIAGKQQRGRRRRSRSRSRTNRDARKHKSGCGRRRRGSPSRSRSWRQSRSLSRGRQQRSGGVEDLLEGDQLVALDDLLDLSESMGEPTFGTMQIPLGKSGRPPSPYNKARAASSMVVTMAAKRPGPSVAPSQALPMPQQSPDEEDCPSFEVADEKEGEQELARWLQQLDGGKGLMLKYLEPLVAEFGSLAAVRASRLHDTVDSVSSVVQCIDPLLFEVLGAQSLGHKLLLAKGVMEL